MEKAHKRSRCDKRLDCKCGYKDVRIETKARDSCNCSPEMFFQGVWYREFPQDAIVSVDSDAYFWKRLLFK